MNTMSLNNIQKGDENENWHCLINSKFFNAIDLSPQNLQTMQDRLHMVHAQILQLKPKNYIILLLMHTESVQGREEKSITSDGIKTIKNE